MSEHNLWLTSPHPCSTCSFPHVQVSARVTHPSHKGLTPCPDVLQPQCYFLLCRYVLFLLPRLTLLDTLLLAEETKALAEATFLKKQMYYNMRIKTLHRHARNLVRQAAEGAKVRPEFKGLRSATEHAGWTDLQPEGLWCRMHHRVGFIAMARFL